MRLPREQLIYAGGALVVLLVWLLLLLAGAVGVDIADLSHFASLFLMLGAIFLAAMLAATRPGVIWFPITWFLLTTAAYFGFGPLMYYRANWETVNYTNQFYPMDWAGLWRVSQLNLAGVALVLGFAVVLRALLRVPDGLSISISRPLTRLEAARAWKLALVFLAVGLPIRWLLGLPLQLGIFDFEMPGVLLQMASLSTLALIPLYVLRGPPTDIRAQTLFLWLAGSELLYGLVSLSKMEILKVLIVMALAATLRPIRFGKLATYGVIGLVSFGLLVPVITYARIAFDVRGLQSAGDIMKLGGDLAGPEAALKLADSLPKVQLWWARVNYAPPQLFTLHAYDYGRPGETFALIPWTFVPRLLYPDKPVMTSGKDFNELINGTRSSQSAPGFFGEGYWNLGWIGVVLTCLVVALVYVLFEIYAVRALIAQRFEYLPVIFLGLFVGIQQDSWAVPTILGALVLGTAYHLMARYLLAPWLNARAKRATGTDPNAADNSTGSSLPPLPA
jgi:hypothetical protein